MQRVLVVLLLSHAFLMNRFGKVDSKSFINYLSKASKQAKINRANTRSFLRSRRSSGDCPVLLKSKTGYNLALTKDGSVTGVLSDDDIYAHFTRIPIDMGIVSLKHEVTGRYLTLGEDGKVHSTEFLSVKNEFYEEVAYNGFLYYVSRQHSFKGEWLIGLNRNGKPIKNIPFSAHKINRGRLRDGQQFIIRPTMC